jgi:hypothetical protein
VTPTRHKSGIRPLRILVHGAVHQTEYARETRPVLPSRTGNVEGFVGRLQLLFTQECTHLQLSHANLRPLFPLISTNARSVWGTAGARLMDDKLQHVPAVETQHFHPSTTRATDLYHYTLCLQECLLRSLVLYCSSYAY